MKKIIYALSLLLFLLSCKNDRGKEVHRKKNTNVSYNKDAINQKYIGKIGQRQVFLFLNSKHSFFDCYEDNCLDGYFYYADEHIPYTLGGFITLNKIKFYEIKIDYAADDDSINYQYFMGEIDSNFNIKGFFINQDTINDKKDSLTFELARIDNENDLDFVCKDTTLFFKRIDEKTVRRVDEKHSDIYLDLGYLSLIGIKDSVLEHLLQKELGLYYQLTGLGKEIASKEVDKYVDVNFILDAIGKKFKDERFLWGVSRNISIVNNEDNMLGFLVRNEVTNNNYSSNFKYQTFTFNLLLKKRIHYSDIFKPQSEIFLIKTIGVSKEILDTFDKENFIQTKKGLIFYHDIGKNNIGNYRARIPLRYFVPYEKIKQIMK